VRLLVAVISAADCPLFPPTARSGFPARAREKRAMGGGGLAFPRGARFSSALRPARRDPFEKAFFKRRFVKMRNACRAHA